MTMRHQGVIIRPPSEARSILLQVTCGCSHNGCLFCGAYRDTEKKFRIRNRKEIRKDLCFASRHFRSQKTLFLADGDALVLDQEWLCELLRLIHEHLPWVRRIATYATCKNILEKSAGELSELKAMGLGRIYMGLESGDDQVLRQMGKNADSAMMIEAAQRVRQAGIFLSVTCILGLAGHAGSKRHALATAQVLNRMRPSQIAVLTLMIMENSPLARMVAHGTFIMASPRVLLQELRTLVQSLSENRVQFHANHASNYLELEGRLPRDREKFLHQIDEILASGRLNGLRAEHERAL